MGKQFFHVFNLVLILLTYIVYIDCGFFRKGAQIEGSVHYVRTCETDKDTRQILKIYYYKFNHTNFASNINLTVLEPLDNSYKLRIAVQRWGDGGWKNNIFNLDRDDACSSLLFLGGTFAKEFIAAAGIKPHCPLEPGFYTLSKFSSTGGGNNTPGGSGGIDSPLIVSPGKYHGVVHFLKHRKISICLELEVEFEETYY